MVVTLTRAARNWLAINAGVDNCFASSNVTYNNMEGIQQTGGTGDVVLAFWTAHNIATTEGNPAKDNVDIKNGMTYVLFKYMNNGVDITLGIPGGTGDDMGDADWAYNSDGHVEATLPLYCADPANIISTNLTVDKTAILEGDLVAARVTWTNDGALPGPFLPGIKIDAIPTSYLPEQLLAGASVAYDFTISELTINGGIPHQICAYPGTHCKNVYVFSSLGICNWIISRGGWDAITSSDLITLAGAFLLHSNLGFPVTMAHIAGVTSYYLKRRSSGNMFTGCNFLT
jgi:hypothetical protein